MRTKSKHPETVRFVGRSVAFILAPQAVIYTYDGWYGVVYFGGEVHDPGRDIPRAIFGTVLSVIAIYFLVNAAAVHLVSVREFAGSDFAMGIAAQRVLGAAGDNFIRVVVVVGTARQRQRDGERHLPGALCHVPRRAFLPAVCARERRRDSDSFVVAFHCGGPIFLAGALASDRQNTPLTFIVLAASYPVYHALKWASQRSAARAALP